MKKMQRRTIDSPIGRICLCEQDGCLTGLKFCEDESFSDEGGVLDRAQRQLAEYFCGARKEFDLPILLEGTPFQKMVWDALREIPYGETVAYGEIARRIGRPRASRAVGMANHAKPISVIVPCHRVIGANGSLTGYGGGIERKRALLELESKWK